MTTEEKAKRYDEALNWMRELHPGLHGATKEDVEHFFPELRESEDERIRKLLVWQVYRNIEDDTNDLAQSVYDGIKGHDPDLEESIEDWKKCLAYLEKQKEQKPAQTSEEKEYIRTLKSLISDFIRDKQPEDVAFYQKIYDWLEGRHVEQKPVVTHGETYRVDTLGTQQVIAGKMPQKPAEWSEEDERKRLACIETINEVIDYERERWEDYNPGKPYRPIMKYDEQVDWLKSLRPSWKPSEEQMSMLLAVINDPNNAGAESCYMTLKSIYNNLKKLM